MLGKFFDARDIDISIVQILVDGGKFLLDKRTVGANGVARQWRNTGLWNERGDACRAQSHPSEPVLWHWA